MNRTLPAPTRGASNRPLLVSRWAQARDSDWADVADSIEEAVRLWRERGHAAVFADFGPLGDGATGTRLARRLRAEGASAAIFLLSDTVHHTQRQWARASGATDVIPRRAQSVAACLTGWSLRDCRPWAEPPAPPPNP